MRGLESLERRIGQPGENLNENESNEEGQQAGQADGQDVSGVTAGGGGN